MVTADDREPGKGPLTRAYLAIREQLGGFKRAYKPPDRPLKDRLIAAGFDPADVDHLLYEYWRRPGGAQERSTQTKRDLLFGACIALMAILDDPSLLGLVRADDAPGPEPTAGDSPFPPASGSSGG
jgi:hypothetical protein